MVQDKQTGGAGSLNCAHFIQHLDHHLFSVSFILVFRIANTTPLLCKGYTLLQFESTKCCLEPGGNSVQCSFLLS